MSTYHRDSNNREVCDLEFAGRYPDVFIARATYIDDGSDVPESELDFIQAEFAKRGECLCRECRECA
jgi:hypothetical protein